MYLIIFLSGGGQYCLSCAINQERILLYTCNTPYK